MRYSRWRRTCAAEHFQGRLSWRPQSMAMRHNPTRLLGFTDPSGAGWRSALVAAKPLREGKGPVCHLSPDVERRLGLRGERL